MSDVRIFSADKILKHLDRVLPWLKGKNVPPITIELDLTNRCNHRCPGCIGGRTGHQDLKNPLKIINQIASFGVKAVTFTGGGEPLLHPQVCEAVEYAQRQGLDVGFITNGSLLNEENASVLVKNCVWVRVSLDASNSREFQSTHGLGGDAFQKVVKNIGLLAKTKKKFQAKCTVGVGYLTNKKMLKGMLPAARLCRKLGVDYIQFRPFHWDFTDISKELKKCKKQETKDFSVLYSKHKYDSMKDPHLGRSYQVCYGHQFAAVICADGNMTVCCHTRGNKKFILGNLYKSSLKAIWNSKKRQRAIANIDLKKCVPLCRCNTFNQVLWNLKQPTEHVNFL
jgi:MoaA/NifB/PqqE/SkfB family radical SAM enzyme